jgi:hypothetical protein
MTLLQLQQLYCVRRDKNDREYEGDKALKPKARIPGKPDSNRITSPLLRIEVLSCSAISI